MGDPLIPPSLSAKPVRVYEWCVCVCVCVCVHANEDMAICVKRLTYIIKCGRRN